MKDLVKFDCMPQKSRVERYSSQPGTSESDSPMAPDGLSSFNLNLSDDYGSGSASKRPMSVRKSKMKRKKGEDLFVVVDEIRESNKKLHQLLEISSAKKDRDMEIQLRKIEAQHKSTEARKRMVDEFRWESDNKILMLDTDSISNSAIRIYFEQEQVRILAKRQQQFNQSTSPNNTFDIGSYFPDMGGSGPGSGSGLGDY